MVKKAKRLIVFDVDGVLLDNKLGGFKDILVLLGKEEAVQRIDEEYQRRKKAGPWGLEGLAALYQGVSEGQLIAISTNYCQGNLAEGAREGLAELKTRGYILGALSSNPQFVMDLLTGMLLLDFSQGTQLEFKKGVATGGIQGKVDRHGKAKILRKRIKMYGLEKADATVVGDSITDLPMAEEAGRFIAFRPKEDIVEERADLIVNSFQALLEYEKNQREIDNN